MTILSLLALGACSPEPSAGRPDRGTTPPIATAPAPAEPDDAPAAEPEPTPCELRTPRMLCRWMGQEGTAFFSPTDGTPRLEMALNLPLDIEFGPDGIAYAIDHNNHRILAVDTDGRVTCVLGVGVIGDGIFDPSTGMWGEGPGLEYKINHPTNVAFSPTDPDGLYVAAWHNSRIVRYEFSTGLVHYFAGTGARSYGGDGGPALEAMFDLPSSLVFDEHGGWWTGDMSNQVIRRVEPDGTVSTVAGILKDPAYDGDGPALERHLFFPVGRVADPSSRLVYFDGSVWFPDSGSNLVRRFDPEAGTIETVAGVWEENPIGLDTNEDSVADLAIALGGYAGDGGPALEARFNQPLDIAIAPDGTIYVADTWNHCVRVITPDGLVDTVAGRCGIEGRVIPGEGVVYGDEVAARDGLLWYPMGVALDSEGNLYIADTYNHVIRVVWAEPAEDPGEIAAP